MASNGATEKRSQRVTVNVGGQAFQTTTATLESCGPGSLLARSAAALPLDTRELFFDRDPACFSVLLTLLRTRRLPRVFDKDALIEEASFFGLLRLLKQAMAPDRLDGIDLHKETNLLPTGRDYPSCLCSADDGSILVAHGSKITAFDWAQRKQRTTLTEFNAIHSMHWLSDTHVVCGAAEFPGLHIYDVTKGIHARSLIWEDPNDPRVYKAAVRAITSNQAALFAAYENGQKLENALLMYDRVTLRVSGEIARQNGNSGHSKVATKLQWLSNYNCLMVVGIHGGTFGDTGYIRLWDPRQSKAVWEWQEPNIRGVDPHMVEADCFADVAVDEEHAGIFKVSIGSGVIAMADVRHLQAQDPWMTLSDVNPIMQNKQSDRDSKLLCYNKQIFCSHGGDLEVWSEVQNAGSRVELKDREYWETSFRKNYIEHSRIHGGYEITHMEAGAQRLFVARRAMQGIEVYETKRATADAIILQ